MHNMPHSEESKKKMSEAHKGKANIARRRKTIVKDGVTLYQCGVCKDFKPYDEFYKNRRTILGITQDCKKCHCKVSIKTRNKDTAHENNRKYMERARKKNIEIFRERERKYSLNRSKDEKYWARKELNNAVKRGDILKPDICEECGRKARITAHHEDYAKPLSVKWLCYKCHGKKHRKEIGNERAGSD